MSDAKRWILVLVVPIMLGAAMAGCVGSGESAEAGDGDDGGVASSVPDEGFSSFDQALDADGEIVEPDPVQDEEIKAEVQGQTVDTPDYSAEHEFDVERETVEQVVVEASFSPEIPDYDEIKVRLLDPSGDEIEAATLSDTATEEVQEAQTEATLDTEDAEAGQWTVEVTGRGLRSASYDLTMRVRYTVQPDLTLKLLEPLEPVPVGSHDFVFLLYDGSEEPVTNASGSLESWMTSMDHGGNETGEEDPTHEEHGVYRGVISPSMAGEWEVRVDLETPGQDGIRFAVPVTIEE